MSGCITSFRVVTSSSASCRLSSEDWRTWKREKKGRGGGRGKEERWVGEGREVGRGKGVRWGEGRERGGEGKGEGGRIHYALSR